MNASAFAGTFACAEPRHRNQLCCLRQTDFVKACAVTSRANVESPSRNTDDRRLQACMLHSLASPVACWKKLFTMLMRWQARHNGRGNTLSTEGRRWCRLPVTSLHRERLRASFTIERAVLGTLKAQPLRSISLMISCVWNSNRLTQKWSISRQQTVSTEDQIASATPGPADAHISRDTTRNCWITSCFRYSAFVPHCWLGFTIRDAPAATWLNWVGALTRGPRKSLSQSCNVPGWTGGTKGPCRGTWPHQASWPRSATIFPLANHRFSQYSPELECWL